MSQFEQDKDFGMFPLIKWFLIAVGIFAVIFIASIIWGSIYQLANNIMF